MHPSSRRRALPWTLFLVCLFLTVGSHAATVDVDSYTVTPVADGDALSARVYQVTATERDDGTGVKVWVYPLLWDSPDPSPTATNAAGLFGSLRPGLYRFAMRIRVLEAPTDLRVSWVPDPVVNGAGSTDNMVLASVPITNLSPSRWYQVEGDVEVTGPDDWDGRVTIGLRSLSGDAARRSTVWLDEIELEQLDDVAGDGDGCDPHCFRYPLDFEAPGDVVGQDPARVFHANTAGQRVLAGVADHLPWQAVPAWFEQSRIHLATRLKARDCVFGQVAQGNTWPVTSDTFVNAAAYLAPMGADVFTRHVKTAAEGPWWPTAVPTTDARFRPDCVNTATPGAEDIAADLIARTHAAGMRQIAYYWMSSEDEIRLDYPTVGGSDWSAFDEVGQP
ncbi:MAG: hypothetical protein AAGD38_14685, partial [Acidobacteriota bacterium]